MFYVYVKELKHGFGIAHKTYIYGNTGTESPFTCKVEQFCLYNNVTTRRKNFILDFSFVFFFHSLLFLHVAKINITKKFIFVGIPEEQQKSLKIHVVVDFCVNVFSLSKAIQK